MASEIYTPRVVGSDRPGVQPIQVQQAPQIQNRASELLQGAAQSSQYAYNIAQQGVESLAKMTQQHTDDAIKRNEAATRVAVTSAQYAGQSQAKLAQELGNLSQGLQQWDTNNQRKKEVKFQQEQQIKKDAVEQERYEYDKWFKELQYSEDLQLKVDDRLTARKEKAIAEAMKLQEAQQLKQYEEEEAKAFIAIRDQMVGMNESAYRDNPLLVRNKLLETISNYNVRPEKIAELLRPAYEQLEGIGTEQFKARQDYADKVQTQLLEQQKYIIANKMSGAFARLKTDRTGDVKPILDEISGHVATFIQENPGMGVLDGITLQNYVLQEANKNITISVDARAEIRARLDKNAGFVNELGREVETFNSGGMGIAEYKMKLHDLAAKYEIPLEEAKELGNPLAVQEFILEQKDVEKKIRELEEAGQTVPDANLSDMQVGTLAWYFHKHPDQYNAIKNGEGEFKNDPTFLRAEGVMQSYKKFAETRQSVSVNIARLERQQAAFGEETLRAAQGTPESSNDFKKKIESQIQVYFGGVDTSAMNPQAYATWEAFRKAGNELFEREKAALQDSYREDYAILQQYGLHEGEKSIQFSKAKYDAIRKQIDDTHRAAQPASFTPGASPNFRGGVSRNSTQYARAEYQGTPILTPFRAGTQMKLGDGHGGAGSPHHGRNRPHAGLDIAVKEGTPLVATGSGVVTISQWQNPNNKKEGYGYYVDIKYDDGRIERYSHLSGSYLQVGQRVNPGQVFAKSGNTGRSSGAHLHWEFRRSSSGGFESSSDPISGANKLLSTVGTVRPRDDNTSWENEYNPYGGTSDKGLQMVIPKNAQPLWKGAYFLDGKIHYVDNPGRSKPANQAYNMKNFVVGSSMERTKTGFKATRDNTGSKNFLYKALAEDGAFRRELHRVATNLNVPAVWLADIMAFETGGTFDPGKDNGLGYTGLIQFGDAAAKDVGTTRAALAKMSRAEQMKYVEKYYRKQMQYAGIKSIDNIETMLAVVWGGAGLVKKFATDPASTNNVRDVNTTFKGYLDKLGSHAGRRYNHYFASRRSNIAKVIHTHYEDGCPVCNQMIASNTPIVPHEGQA